MVPWLPSPSLQGAGCPELQRPPVTGLGASGHVASPGLTPYMWHSAQLEPGLQLEGGGQTAS